MSEHKTRIQLQKRIRELEAEREEINAHLKRGCNHYCDWYANGSAANAGTVAYDLYGDLRLALHVGEPAASECDSKNSTGTTESEG